MSVHKKEFMRKSRKKFSRNACALALLPLILVAIFLTTRQSAINPDRAVARHASGQPILVKVDRLPADQIGRAHV